MFEVVVWGPNVVVLLFGVANVRLEENVDKNML